jgi:drug/metabolite transporter (DMT)-like permease
MVTTTDYLKLHFIVFLWGFTAVLGKLVTIPSVEMVFYRTLLAAIGMGALIILVRGSFHVKGIDLFILALTGFILAIHWLTFFASGRIANPSTSLVGFSTCSLWAALIEPIAKRKKIQLLEVGLGVIVLTGLTIIFSYDFQYKLGLLLGIASGFTIAICGVINSKMVIRMNAYVITFYEMAGAWLGVILFLPFYIHVWATDQRLNLNPSPNDWLYIALMAWACSVYAYSVSINLSKRLSIFFIQLTLNLEPLYGIILALWVFGKQEIMGFRFYFGTAIILSAVAAYPLIKRRNESKMEGMQPW